MPSLLYPLVINGLKLIGPKKIFKQAPMPYQKMRKYDRKSPSGGMRRKFEIGTRQIAETPITTLRPKGLTTAQATGHVLLIPGGAFVSGPAKHHWDSLATILPAARRTAWMVDYPKGPETKLEAIHRNLDAVYAAAAGEFGAGKLALIGDSAGGNLIMTLVQRLVAAQEALPEQLILITPMFDASMENPDIEQVDRFDPMLSKPGAHSAHEMTAGKIPLKDPAFSPLFGTFEGFPTTTLYLGERDILCPDGVLGAQKMQAAGIKLNTITGKHMPHIYPLLPVLKEARQARQEMIGLLSGS